MLTIFTIPKPFTGHIGLIQRNALASWRRLSPSAEIILFGSEAGVSEAADQFGARHEPELRGNAFGTPLVSDAFSRARSVGTQPLLMFSNADMLYDESLVRALGPLEGRGSFLLSGRRWDRDIKENLAAMDNGAWSSLFAARSTLGRLNGPSAMDYFAFPRTLDLAMPEFAVGRVGWDSWLVWHCRQVGISVIDATADVAAVHQNHSYSTLALGCQHRRGPERDLNIRQAGGLSHLLTLREASLLLVDGHLRRPTGMRRWLSCLATSAAYLQVLAFKRWLLSRVGG